MCSYFQKADFRMVVCLVIQLFKNSVWGSGLPKIPEQGANAGLAVSPGATNNCSFLWLEKPPFRQSSVLNYFQSVVA